MLTPCYTVSFEFVSERGPSSLYSYNIPISEYSAEHRDHILEKQRSFNETLNKYGYSIMPQIFRFKEDNIEHNDI